MLLKIVFNSAKAPVQVVKSLSLLVKVSAVQNFIPSHTEEVTKGWARLKLGTLLLELQVEAPLGSRENWTLTIESDILLKSGYDGTL
jgi:hypothetical protein